MPAATPRTAASRGGPPRPGTWLGGRWPRRSRRRRQQRLGRWRRQPGRRLFQRGSEVASAVAEDSP